MSFEEFLAKSNEEGEVKAKRSCRDIEHNHQVACVKWFRMQYSHLAGLLFAVPNGGARNAKTGKKLKDEGVTRGVSDLILLVPNKQYHALCIEIKTDQKGSSQSEYQKAFQSSVQEQGYAYAISRNIDEFQHIINSYFNNSL